MKNMEPTGAKTSSIEDGTADEDSSTDDIVFERSSLLDGKRTTKSIMWFLIVLIVVLISLVGALLAVSLESVESVGAGVDVAPTSPPVFESPSNAVIPNPAPESPEKTQAPVAVDKPSLRPTVKPTLAPQVPPSNVPRIELVVTNNDFTFKLGLCQGDCDNDTHCQDGMYCFQRSPHQPVPHCLGAEGDYTYNDYCTYRDPTEEPTKAPTRMPVPDPTAKPTLKPVASPTKTPTAKPVTSPTFPSSLPRVEFVEGRNDFNYKLGLCQGDCDGDGHCQDGMYCHQRGANEPVPHCAGGESDSSNTDYCTWRGPTTPPVPNPTPLPTPNPTPPPVMPVDPSVYPDPNGRLQYYAYYYPWYYKDDWSRHGFPDIPLLGLYGTNEVAVAEQHIEWALQTGITSWVVSWWGEHHLAMKHFKQGMMNANNFRQVDFFMLYESKILEGRGSWRDGTKEALFLDHLKIIRDSFFDQPNYLRINGRPVIMLYITRSQFQWQNGFTPEVLNRVRQALGHDVYFIADEPFFNWYNDDPDDNQNAIVNGKQVFDAYTTYNMFVDSKVREGETATDYQLREGMPIWRSWAEELLFWPNVMAQYFDFRGHKPLLGHADDFRRQLREVACLPRTNYNGAPNVMFITSFNEWWEGTQIEPENGSPDNWNNYGFDFMNVLADFKRDVDTNGFYWC